MENIDAKNVAKFMEDSKNHVIWRRLFAANVDFILWFGTLIIPDYLLGNDLYQKTIFAWLPLTIFFYFALPEGLTGYSIGKWIFRARVVNEKGSLPGLKAGAIRSFIRLFEGTFISLPAAIVALLSKRSQRLGDMAAKTYVMSSKNARDFISNGHTT